MTRIRQPALPSVATPSGRVAPTADAVAKLESSSAPSGRNQKSDRFAVNTHGLTGAAALSASTKTASKDGEAGVVSTQAAARLWKTDDNSADSALGGIRLAGVDLNSIEHGLLKLSFPLRAGVFKIPTSHADAEAKVYNSGQVTMELEVAQNDKGVPAVQGARISFTPEIVVLNPASSLQPSGDTFLGRLWDSIQDKFGNVRIKSIFVKQDGSIDIDGEVEKSFPLDSEPLSKNLDPHTFPRLNLDLRSIVDGKAIAEPAKPSSGKRDPSLADLLQSLGAITKVGHCELSLRTGPSTLTLDGAGLSMRSVESPMSIDLDGRAQLTEKGTLLFRFEDREGPEFCSGAIDMDLTANVALQFRNDGPAIGGGWTHSQARLGAMSGRYSSGESVDVPIELKGADSVLVGKTAFMLKDGGVDIRKGSTEAHIVANSDGACIEMNAARVRLDGSTLSADAGLHFTYIKGMLSVDNGEGTVRLHCEDTQLLQNGTAVRVPGRTDIKLVGERIRLDAGQSLPSAEGKLRMSLLPPGMAPELNPAWGEFGYKLGADGQVRVLPGKSGVTEAFLPIQQLQGQPQNLVDPDGPGVAPVGSAEMKEHIQRMTGAAISSHNQVELLVDGVVSHQRRLHLIRNAKKTLCVQTLIFKEDKTGLETAHELIAAAQRGVDVRVIIDALGNVESQQNLVEGKKLYQMLEEGGVKVSLYNDPRNSPAGALLKELAADPSLSADLSVDKLLQDPLAALTLMQKVCDVASGHAHATPQSVTCAQNVLAQGAADSDAGLRTVDTQLLGAATLGDDAAVANALNALRNTASLNHRWHEKYLIADGQIAITGGMNIADEYLLGGTDAIIGEGDDARPAWRDTDIAVQGQAAVDMYAAFARNWQWLGGEALADVEPIAASVDTGCDVQFIQHKPRYLGDHHITNFYIEQIKALEPGQKCYIANAYFLPTGALEGLKDALMDAAERGVDVRVVTNSEESNDLPALNQASLPVYQELLEAGVRIFERSGRRTMHTKAAVFGGNTASIGSWNCDNRSASLNSEDVTNVYDATFAKQVQDMIVDDMRADVARELSVDIIRQRILDGGMKHALVGLFANLM